MRIDPSPSLACAVGTIPAATADAAPPEEPPAMWSGFHGLRHAPRRSEFVTPGDAELGRVGLAQQHQSRGPVAAHQFAVARVWCVGCEPAPAGAGHARHFQPQILHQERHAAEGAFRQVASGGRTPFVEGAVDHGIELAVPLYALDGRLGQLAGRDLASSYQFSQPDAVVLGVLRERHDPPPYASPA
jgi:hypothetical protein